MLAKQITFPYVTWNAISSIPQRVLFAMALKIDAINRFVNLISIVCFFVPISIVFLYKLMGFGPYRQLNPECVVPISNALLIIILILIAVNLICLLSSNKRAPLNTLILMIAFTFTSFSPYFLLNASPIYTIETEDNTYYMAAYPFSTDTRDIYMYKSHGGALKIWYIINERQIDNDKRLENDAISLDYDKKQKLVIIKSNNDIIDCLKDRLIAEFCDANLVSQLKIER